MGNVCGGQSLADQDGGAGRGSRSASNRGSTDMLGNPHDASGRGDPASAACGSVQTKGGTPGTISIKVAPAPPPSGDEYPEIKAAVQAAQKEVKAGAKLKFSELYRLGQVVGTGHYARVQLAMSLKDGRKYAVKIMQKADGKEALLQQLQNIVKEVAIMRLLADHPNMVQLEQVLQDSTSFYLVMEHCNGGELFDQIIRSGHMTEAMAASKAKQLISFLAHSHAKHVIHRDIKPENLLLLKTDKEPVLKVIDYGCSTFCVPGKRLCKKFGTPYYVAPEVLWRDYDLQADVWSAGVVLFILLCGRPPFNGKNDEDIVAKVRTGHVKMCADEWSHVSCSGKALVREMLKLDVTMRPTCQQLLEHPWFSQAGEDGQGSVLPEGNMSHVVARLEAFAGMSRMKRLALAVLCHTVTDRHITRLKEAFYALDEDGDGHLTPAELTHALRSTDALAKSGFAAEIPPEALEELIAASDLYGEGYVDVDEFLAAMLANSNYTKTKDALRRSFDALDHDHDGFISAADLLNLQQQLLGEHHITKELAEEMMSEVSSCIDEAHDGRMNYQEFCHMMTDETNSHYHPKEPRRFSFESTCSGKALSEATVDAFVPVAFAPESTDDMSEQQSVAAARQQAAAANEQPAAAGEEPVAAAGAAAAEQPAAADEQPAAADEQPAAADEQPAAAGAAAEQLVSAEQVKATVN